VGTQFDSSSSVASDSGQPNIDGTGEIGVIRKLAESLRESKPILSPLQWRSHAASYKLTALDIPDRCGGQDWSAAKMLPLFLACGYHDLDLRDVPGAGHARLLSLVKTRRFDQLLRDVASAKAFVAIAITEEEGGSDLRSLGSSAILHSDHYCLNGKKKYVSRLAEATHIIVFVQVHRSRKNLTAFLVPREHPGLWWTPLDSMGLTGVSWGELHLQNVRVPISLRIGGEGEAASLFVRHFTYWRLAMAAAVIGCARAALDQVIVWMQNRFAFGAPIGRFTHLQQELAIHISRIHMLGLLVHAAAVRLDDNKPAVADAAMAKAEAVESAISAVQFSMLVHGARGYDKSVGLEKRLRDLLGLRVADGTTDVLRGQVAQSVLGNELYNLSLGRPAKQDWSSIQTRRFW
jgi:cyclohexanecarboxyl-CoA dehydrogenase